MDKYTHKIKALYNSRGFALPLVLGVMAVLAILSFSAYQISINNQTLLSRTIDTDKALYQAENGYNQCLWELNSTSYTFYKALDKNPEDYTFNGAPYKRYRLPDQDNYRLEILVPMKKLPGVDDLQESNNDLIIRSTGWETSNPNYMRTIEVEVYKRSFTQHVAVNNTEKGANGQKIYWTNRDEMYGPFHTNDTLYVRGAPNFYGLVTYGKGIAMEDVNGNTISGNQAILNPYIFHKGVAKTDALPLPTSNPELKAHSLINGHYYNGRTCIYLLEEGGYNVRTYDAKNKVWKYNGVEYEIKDENTRQWTQNERENERNTGNKAMYHRKDNNTSYFSFDAMAATIDSLELPNNGVIYVDGKQGNGTGSNKFDRELGNVFVSGKLKDRLTITAANDIYITAHDPCDWKRPPAANALSNWLDTEPGVTYNDTKFDQVFGSDGLWDYTAVKDSYSDMLGLVANRKIQILHYGWPSNFNYSSHSTPNYYWNVNQELHPSNVYIYAAMYAATEVFGFEDYDRGSYKGGDIVLYGSITQQYRGPVGTFSGNNMSTGYNKKYSHDPRMLVDAPPFYPNPSDIGWLSSRWNETENHILAKED